MSLTISPKVFAHASNDCRPICSSNCGCKYLCIVYNSVIVLEIGVPADSCDNYYIAEDEAMPNWLPYKKSYSEWRKEAFGLSHGYTEIIPCWSVGRLMEIFDICCILKDGTEWMDTQSVPVSYVSYLIDCYVRAIKHKQLDFSKLND